MRREALNSGKRVQASRSFFLEITRIDSSATELMALYFTTAKVKMVAPAFLPAERWNPEEIQELAPLKTALAAEEGARARSSPSVCTRTSTRWEPRVLVQHRHPRRWKLEFNVREPSED